MHNANLIGDLKYLINLKKQLLGQPVKDEPKTRTKEYEEINQKIAQQQLEQEEEYKEHLRKDIVSANSLAVFTGNESIEQLEKMYNQERNQLKKEIKALDKNANLRRSKIFNQSQKQTIKRTNCKRI